MAEVDSECSRAAQAAEDMQFLIQRLLDMALIKVYTPTGAGEFDTSSWAWASTVCTDHEGGPTIELGDSLDVDDAADALAGDVEDDLARHLLGKGGEMPPDWPAPEAADEQEKEEEQAAATDGTEAQEELGEAAATESAEVQEDLSEALWDALTASA
eukprot:gnl/TRDRNA2_/TRDRNA2_180767_c1_seq1.p1 gnl/TRDRNA2_/TRDRNA2_180767_c1~~gnl/TRDRNA2_/TRDRNA2_180767_c1_seq1.p1  ORF type:complete len:168 (+),score=61.07 gnl/TRDRNA2_/TRDRNA2_180767_c1_seq1:35-505(+)